MISITTRKILTMFSTSIIATCCITPVMASGQYNNVDIEPNLNKNESLFGTTSPVKPLKNDDILVNYTCNIPEALQITSGIESKNGFLPNFTTILNINPAKYLISAKVSFFQNQKEVDSYFYCNRLIRAEQDDESITIHFTVNTPNISDDKVLVNYTCNTLDILSNISSIESRNGFKLDLNKILNINEDDNIADIKVTSKYYNGFICTCPYTTGDTISVDENVKSITIDFTIDTPSPNKIPVYILANDCRLPENILRQPYYTKIPLQINPESTINFNEIITSGIDDINISVTTFYQDGCNNINVYTSKDSVFIDKNVESVTINIQC